MRQSSYNLWIDAAPLLPPRTGIGRYCAGLLQGLAELHENGCDIPKTWLIRTDGGVQAADWATWGDDIQWTASAGSSWRRSVLNWVRRTGRHVRGVHTLSNVARAVRLQAALWRAHTHARSVLHGTNFLTPHVARRYVDATVLTVHDMSCFDVPETHPVERVQRLQRLLPAAVEHAQMVLCPSAHAAARLQHWLGVASHKIRVTPLGVEPFFFDTTRQQDASILLRYGLLARRYWLSVATIEPRKNLALVLRAYGRLALPWRQTHPLVVVGVKGWKTSEIERLMDPFLRDGTLRLLGHVPDADLPALYANALATLYVSRYEGFGLPVAEAMACGSLVVAANGTSIPEVLGDAGLMLHPDDVDALTTYLTSIADQPTAYDDLRVKARQRAAQSLRWRHCAELTLKAYGECLQ